MLCAKCGSENSKEETACQECGADLTNAPADTQDKIPNKDKITWSELLFSFKGRIPRSTYWLKWSIPIIVISIILDILDPMLGTTYMIDPELNLHFGILSLIFTIVIIYPSTAVAFKRCHDRGRSGWFLLLFLIPIVNLWPTIELAFIKGTNGPNKYGDDPLGSR
jgi:uncharacterized membrane protein YhaH (DUF805 family)